MSNTMTITTTFDVYWPVPWKGVTSKFGTRFHPVQKKNLEHYGVDLKASYAKVRASEDGIIKEASSQGNYGNLIIIEHSNGYETRYAHLDTFEVNKGDKVVRGQQVGISGQTGGVTGPHLHYEVRKNGIPLNPMRFFK